MHKISQLVDKKLIDVNSAQDCGAIASVIWDKLSGKCNVMTSEGKFAAESVFSVKDAVSVLNACVTTDGEELGFGKIAYDTTGKYLGKITDVEFGNTLKLHKVHLDNGIAYGRGKIYAVKDVMLIRAKTPIAKKSAKPSTDKNAEKRTPLKINSRWNQNRKYGDFSFLIGKIADKNITNFQNELMIRRGEAVSNEVLRQAKISGKLIELCLHAK